MAAVEDPAGREASRQHLSDHHSFVLCDAKVSGCPIRHASDGFKDMFRYAVGESPARTDKIDGCSSIMDSEAGVVAAARAGGLSPQDVVKALQLLENVAADVCTGIASGSRVGQSSSVLLVKARRGGEMFACLLSLVLHRHPTTGWSFLVGLHKDISDHLAVRDLLRAALSGGPSVQAILGGLTTHIGVQQGLLSHPQSVVHLNEAFDKVWRGFLSGLGRMGESGSTGGHAGAGEGGKHHSGLGGKQSKLKAARSEVSAATTASRVSTGRRACGGTVATTSPTLPPAVAKWRSEMPPSEWNDLSESPLHNNLLDLLEPVDVAGPVYVWFDTAGDACAAWSNRRNQPFGPQGVKVTLEPFRFDKHARKAMWDQFVPLFDVIRSRPGRPPQERLPQDVDHITEDDLEAAIAANILPRRRNREDRRRAAGGGCSALHEFRHT